MTRSIVKSIDYEARRSDDGDVEIVVSIESVGFVRETIPDGQLAGMMGHREVPQLSEYIYSLHPQQARRLVEQIQRILGP